MLITKVKMLIAKLIGDDKYYTYKIIKEVRNQPSTKDIIIYGVNNNSLRMSKWLKVFCKKDVKYYIDDTQSQTNNRLDFSVHPPEVLLTEKVDNIIIIIADTSSAVKKMENLFELGVENESILYFAPEKILGSKVMDTYDVNLGYTRIDDLPGFCVFGNMENWGGTTSVKIVTLGGSTTDATFNNIKSWSECLYERLTSILENTEVIVLCGGMCGYKSSQELLKFIRDVLPLTPDFVIDYSGINNRPSASGVMVNRHPFVWKYQYDNILFLLNKRKLVNTSSGNGIDKITTGLADNRNDADCWVDDMRMIHAICNEFSIEHIAILQPCMAYGGYDVQNNDPFSSGLVEYAVGLDTWYETIKEKIKGLTWCYDFSMIFSGMKHIFTDPSHVTEKGNRIIANHILKIILPIIQRRIRK